MAYTVERGLVRGSKGIPEGQKWFADNRLSVQFDETGVTRVEYRTPRQTAGNPIVLLKGVHDGFRYYLEHKGVTSKAEYENSTLWPFGIDSEWSFEKSVFQHGVYTIHDSIVVKLVTPERVPEGLVFKLEFNEACAFVPSEQRNPILGLGEAIRSWKNWIFDDREQVLLGGYTEKPVHVEREATDIRSSYVENKRPETDAALHIFMGADFPLRHVQRASKHILYSDELKPATTYCFVVSFIADGANAIRRYQEGAKNIRKNLENRYARYQKVMDRSPRLVSPYEQLNRFVSLAPMYHEALKVSEYPGAVRAKTSNYWVWGWDGLTSNSASLYWGDRDFVRDMLGFYEKTAHPERGIAHSYRNDMSVASISDLPSQGMYITLLHHYYNATKDIGTVKERYAFAKKIFRSIATSEVGGTGFCEGTSLFPDFPVYMKETGHDISAFNNTVFYCASRSMESLAALLGDEELRLECETIFRKMEKNFIKLFFDAEKGFIVNSVDAVSLRQRACYSSDAVKWENEYCGDLLETISSQSMEFFARNFVSKAGIRPMPVWDSAFDGDANQLHSWWPVMGEYYMKLINENDRTDLIDQWIGWVSYWTESLTIPEGIPCYIDTAEPEHDCWDTLRGTWQAYSVRGWYQALIHGVVGVEIDAGGVAFHPYDGAEMKLLGLHYMGKTLDIELYGSGTFIDRIEVDGKTVRGTNKLPADLFGDKDRIGIQVYRVKENPFAAYIKDAVGLQLEEYRYDAHGISAKVSGPGTSRMKIAAEKAFTAKLDGVEIPVRYDAGIQLAILEFKLKSGEKKDLSLSLDR